MIHDFITRSIFSRMREVIQQIYVPHTKDIDRLELIQRHVIILAGVSSFIG